MAMVQGNCPLGDYSFERAGLMSAAKSTLSDDVHHRTLPPWGLYLFKFLALFPHHPHFCGCVNYDDAMPRMVTCDAFDSTKKESTTPKGVASTLHLPPRVASYRRQPRAIECIPPMGLPYHHPLITTPQHDDGPRHGIYHHATIWSVNIPFRWGCTPHAHSLPQHGIEIVRIMAIYHHAITRGVAIPQHGIAYHIAIYCQTMA